MGGKGAGCRGPARPWGAAASPAGLPAPADMRLCVLPPPAAGTQMGHLTLEPVDIEVITKEELKSYWLHRGELGTPPKRPAIHF